MHKFFYILFAILTCFKTTVIIFAILVMLLQKLLKAIKDYSYSKTYCDGNAMVLSNIPWYCVEFLHFTQRNTMVMKS